MAGNLYKDYDDNVSHILAGVYGTLYSIRNFLYSGATKSFHKIATELPPVISATKQMKDNLSVLIPPEEKAEVHKEVSLLIDNTLHGLVLLLSGYEEDYENTKNSLFKGFLKRKSPKVTEGLQLLLRSQDQFTRINGDNIAIKFIQKLQQNEVADIVDTTRIYLCNSDGSDIQINSPLTSTHKWSHYYIPFYKCVVFLPSTPCTYDNILANGVNYKTFLSEDTSGNEYLITRQPYKFQDIQENYTPHLYGELLVPLESVSGAANYYSVRSFCYNKETKLFYNVKEIFTNDYRYTLMVKSNDREPISSSRFLMSFKYM